MRFAPPLVITEEQLLECCRIIALSVRQFAQGRAEVYHQAACFLLAVVIWS